MKRQYKVDAGNGVEYYTDNRWEAIRLTLFLIGVIILNSRLFWIILAIVAGAYIMRGGC